MRTPNRSIDDDRGAQVERTVLAWNRAAIAVAANGALLVRAGFVHHLIVLETAGFAVGLIAFALWSLSLLRYSSTAGVTAPYLFGRKTLSAPPLAAFVLILSLVNLSVVAFAR